MPTFKMAVQLTTFRLFGGPAVTYESTQVVPMFHGRTETARTVAPASVAFCHAMQQRDVHGNTVMVMRTRPKKLNLMKDATEGHVKYS